jgi:O-methyltransferase
MPKLLKYAGKFLNYNYKKLYYYLMLGTHDDRVSGFIESGIGDNYGLEKNGRIELVKKFLTIDRKMKGGPGTPYFLLMAKEIFSIPKDRAGDLIECGSYKGKSTCFFSLLAALTNRTFWVCDSFEGLPEEKGNMLYTDKYQGHKAQYAKGDFTGTLDEVKANLEKFGKPEVCRFVKGFFNESLKTIPDNKYVFAFIDVDLVSSTKDCLLHIWPRLSDEGKLYSDDAGVVEIEKIFFDDAWWKENFTVQSPGFAGSGVGVAGFHSLGYAYKKTDTSAMPVYEGAKG